VSQELSSTLEDYLETIYRLERRNRVARPRDICEAQGVAASTVTSALQSLAEKQLINYEPYEVITLTEEGREYAENLVMGHRIIRDFLENILGLDAERADATACGMEHALDAEGLERLLCFLAFMKHHSAAGKQCIEDFREFVKDGEDGETCEECVEKYIESVQQGN